MKTLVPEIQNRLIGVTRKLASTAGVFLFAATAMVAKADDKPDRRPSTAAPLGYYKVTQSSDPLFPQGSNKEWFLDFGNALERGHTSGTVAVSMRENPSVRVRILVWQLYRENGTLVIGNQTEEGSHKAVPLASFQVSSLPSGLLLERNNYQVSLQRAVETD